MARLTADAKALAEADPVMAALIGRIGHMDMERRRRGRPKGDVYATLVRAIIGQQLSVKAAATIHGRMLELFGGENPSPQQLLDTDEDELRGVGLSGRKVSYLQDLARHVLDGSLEVDRLDQLSDDDVIEEITAVHGLGKWSAQVFLMFHLERPDVLPTGDLGIRKAAQNEYGLGEMPKPDELTAIAEPWRPYRTLASLYLWESLANAPVD
jgi:DNA-3-methyladenine glycosylase II